MWRWRTSEEESGGYAGTTKWVQIKLQTVDFIFLNDLGFSFSTRPTCAENHCVIKSWTTNSANYHVTNNNKTFLLINYLLCLQDLLAGLVFGQKGDTIGYSLYFYFIAFKQRCTGSYSSQLRMCSEAGERLQGRASSFRKVCRLTLWPQSDVIAHRGRRGGGGTKSFVFPKSLTARHIQWWPLMSFMPLWDQST